MPAGVLQWEAESAAKVELKKCVVTRLIQDLNSQHYTVYMSDLIQCTTFRRQSSSVLNQSIGKYRPAVEENSSEVTLQVENSM